MKCKNCASDLNDGIKFCPNCGTKVDSEYESFKHLNDKTDEGFIDQDESHKYESLLNNKKSEDLDQGEKTGFDDLNKEPQRHVTDDDTDKEVIFASYQEERKKSQEKEEKSFNDYKGVKSNSQEEKNRSADNLNQDIWSLLNNINTFMTPLTDLLKKYGSYSLVGLSIIALLIQQFASKRALGFFAVSLASISLLSAGAKLAIGFFVSRWLFQKASQKYGVTIEKQLLNQSILLTVIFSSILSLLNTRSNIIISIIITLLAVGFLLSLVIKSLNKENYGKIGVRYLVYQIIFSIVLTIATIAIGSMILMAIKNSIGNSLNILMNGILN